MTPLLRPATTADIEAGAALQRACWREAYGPYVDAALLEERLADPAPWVAAWTRQLASGPPRTVAESDGALVGFAVAGPSRDEDGATPYELYAIYTRAAFWGTGLGQRLWEEVRPDGPCSLWVLAANERAQGFYRRNGFAADGAREHYADLGADEIRMVRP
ncbi:GNAT family N-acetyltransferase [Nocardioides mangrovi]|uniref:GNAT family N-acetyltransferase n=1 Tax=Nocardioides mangrovi TaxID=2874580 RepID=A0ABS7UIG2_9ACTN|nr:GNAT family N-acetyltransferase [Nocardioides mangrovi]MBZ5740428.1 GNAT family N-acetyltransferase [Nocardioides mangrovi]